MKVETIKMDDVSTIRANSETELLCQNNKIINEIKAKLKLEQYVDEEEKQKLIRIMKKSVCVCENFSANIEIDHTQLLDHIRDTGIEEAIAFQIYNHPEFISILKEFRKRHITIPKNAEFRNKFELAKKQLEKQSRFDDVEFLNSIEYLSFFIISKMSKIHEQKMSRFSRSNSWVANEEDVSFNTMVGSEISADKIRNKILDIPNNSLEKAIEMYKRIQVKKVYTPQSVKDGETNNKGEEKMNEETVNVGEDTQSSEDTKSSETSVETEEVKAAHPEKRGGSRVSKKFEAKVGISPVEYIEKNIDPGSVSRWDMGKSLTTATEETVNVSASTAWQIVKRAQKQGDLSGFFFKRRPKVHVKCSIESNKGDK